jgi:hypothetical protein
MIKGKLRYAWLRFVERKWGTSRYSGTMKWRAGSRVVSEIIAPHKLPPLSEDEIARRELEREIWRGNQRRRDEQQRLNSNKPSWPLLSNVNPPPLRPNRSVRLDLNGRNKSLVRLENGSSATCRFVLHRTKAGGSV